MRQLKRNHVQQQDHRKHELEVRQALQLRPGGRAFSILNTAVDATERAEVAALGQR
ncbi:MAG TPA: hypothetical protein VMX16_07205 [Terriglobia bacterium]|nr:hypothetical protein [Terriglobia bacterium]